MWASAASTHLKKLDTIQRMAARVICHAARQAHSQPLTERRTKHITDIVETCLAGNCHPSFKDMFQLDPSGTVLSCVEAGRINIGKRRLELYAREVYNK